MVRVRILSEREGTPGEVREVSRAQARELVARGDAERIVERANTDIERSVR